MTPWVLSLLLDVGIPVASLLLGVHLGRRLLLHEAGARIIAEAELMERNLRILQRSPGLRSDYRDQWAMQLGKVEGLTKAWELLKPEKRK